ncbi:Gfo/Idh/MocA family protein [Streptosporangium vulgare]
MPVPAVQLYSVRTEIATRPAETLRSVAEMGFRAVEPTAGLVGDDPHAFRDALASAGLTVSSLHGPLLDERRDAVAAAARAIGTDTVVIPAIAAEGFADRASVEDSARRVNEAVRWAAGAGLRLGYHNHHWEFAQVVAGRPAFELFADLLEPEALLEIDVYWAHMGGADVPELLGRLGERVSHLHVKDGPGTVDAPMTAVGSGTLPIPAILAAAPPGGVADRGARPLRRRHAGRAGPVAALPLRAHRPRRTPGMSGVSDTGDLRDTGDIGSARGVRGGGPVTDGPVGVAVVGCGVISGQYLRNLTAYPAVRVVACADLDRSRAEAAAAEHGVAHAGDPGEVLGLPEVELVVNLTVPAAHAEVAGAAVAAGRHVYNEKPLTLDRESARRLLAAAGLAGVRVGSAPDTFLGAGLQAMLRLLAEGGAGRPLSAVALMQGPGPQRWHHDPEFLFRRGGGPLFDMGPYYLTALVAALGPVARVTAMSGRSLDRRVIGAGPRAGTSFPVEVATHVTALLEFASGAVATTVFSFDSPLGRQDFLEFTCAEATVAGPNPNGFGGPLRSRRAGETEWSALPVPGTVTGRGVGVAEMAVAIRRGRPHRASGELGLHVLDVMTSIGESAERGEFVDVTSTCPRPDPLPEGWDPRIATPMAQEANMTI